MAVRAPVRSAQIDARYDRNALIFADLSNDSSYGEQLLETFGPRVIGMHIGRHGNGMQVERRPVGRGCLPIYHVGRSHLREALHSDLQAGRLCFADGPEARRAYAQLEALEPEMREGGIVYKCLPGQHDDLGISCAMLNWAARHPHLDVWMGNMMAARRPRRRPPDLIGRRSGFGQQRWIDGKIVLEMDRLAPKVLGFWPPRPARQSHRRPLNLV